MALSIIDQLQIKLSRSQNLRRLFCDNTGAVKPEAVEFFSWMHEFCHVARPVYKQNPNTGQVDPYATHVTAGRQEVYQELMRRMKMDTTLLEAEINKLREDEQWSKT